MTERKIRKWLTAKNGITFFLIAGIVLRIWYAVVTPVTLRSHDLWELSLDANGKAGYLLRLVESWELPSSYELQNYQQPFYYLLSAVVAKLMSAFSGITTAEFLLNGGKVVSCVSSCLFLILAERLLRRFDETEVRVYGVAILSVTPAFILTAGRVSEDALVGLFMLAVLMGTIRWEKSPDWKNTVLLAFLYGFGMMTKISLVFPAVYTAVIFWKNRRTRRFLPKMAVFGVISLPLGLWYSVRNLIRFGQPLGYVLSQEGTLYTGDRSYVARFLSLDVGSLFASPYVDVSSDYNFSVYLLKSELFGEFGYEVPVWLPHVLLFVSAVLTLLAAGYGGFRIICCLRTKEWGNGGLRPYSFGLLFGAYAAVSYYRFPNTCSMDFRYYLMLTVCKALVLGCLLRIKPQGRYEQEQRFLLQGVKVLCVLFVVFSFTFVVWLL